jgi:hypothetical protein
MPTPFKLNAHYYQQIDADLTRGVPAEGYGGWKQSELTFDRERTALVVMHAWDCGTPEKFPGWYRAVEYIPRAQRIAREVFPPLLSAVRETGFRLYHVVGAGDDYKTMAGHLRALKLAGPAPRADPIEIDDPVQAELARFRSENIFVGTHNVPDVTAGFRDIGFMREALPRGEEGIAEDAHQLSALCRADGINHLIYAGFAINWCLLMSPGGMLDMSRRGVMCSAIRQAVTAVENKESARTEAHKEEALWRVALAFGFVFDVDEFIPAVRATAR